MHPGPDVGSVRGADVIVAGATDLLAKVERGRVGPGCVQRTGWVETAGVGVGGGGRT